MMRQRLARAAEVLQLLSGLLVAAWAANFVMASLATARAVTPPPARPRPLPGLGGADLPIAAGSASASASASHGRPAPTGPVHRISIVVEAGPPRSDVFVAGTKLGQTPFVGEISCALGSEIKIQVLPPKGPPTDYLRRCGEGGVTIR